jgi:hypothetical protein
MILEKKTLNKQRTIVLYYIIGYYPIYQSYHQMSNRMPQNCLPREKREYLGKCNNLNLKEKKSYLER